eukprot:scpid30493/ scgid9981/ WD repeat-containing protein 63
MSRAGSASSKPPASASAAGGEAPASGKQTPAAAAGVTANGSSDQDGAEGATRSTAATPAVADPPTASDHAEGPASQPDTSGGDGGAEGEGEGSETQVEKIRIRKLPDELPAGAKPLFMSGPSQEIFHCTPDVDINDADMFKLILKADIMQDFKNRASVCDFHPVKSDIQNYPGDEVLIVMDRDYKYGENFVVCLTEEAKEFFLQLPFEEEHKTKGGGEGSDGEDEDEEDIPIPKTPIPRPWENLGSDMEVIEAQCKNQRHLLQVKYFRKRRFFGAPVEFSDSDFKERAVHECLPSSNEIKSVPIMEKDKAIQAIPETTDAMIQTTWVKKVHMAIQYEPRTEPEKPAEETPATAVTSSASIGVGTSTDQQPDASADRTTSAASQTRAATPAVVTPAPTTSDGSDDIDEVLRRHLPNVLGAIQQNNLINIFKDNCRSLPVEEGDLGTKADTAMKEYQSFTDLKYSKDRTSTCVRWHPTIKGLIGVSYAHALTFDERIDMSSTIRLSQSLILLWSFSDPIHPLLLLEAPEDVTVFEFCPTHPNIVAAGCVSGQLVLWDLSDYDGKLRNHMALTKDGKSEGDDAAKVDTNRERDKNFFDRSTKAGQAETVHYHIAATIEDGHQSIVTELFWLPSSVEFDRMGNPLRSKAPMSVQIVTAAADGSVNVWDLRRPPKKQNEIARKEAGHPADAVLKTQRGTRIPSTFKHLSTEWKPYVHLVYGKSDAGVPYSPYKLATRLQSEQDKDAVYEREIPLTTLPPPSSADLVALDESIAKYYIGTEDGELMYVSWPFVKDSDSAKWITQRPLNIDTTHSGSIASLERSPFFEDIILSVSQWTFALWKEGVEAGPLMHSAPYECCLTVGKWSPTRPGVFFIGKANGTVEIWDLLDKSHIPTLSQNISALGITTLVPHIQKGRKKQQVLLAIGDRSGTLHVTQLPWSLAHCSPSERTSAQAFFEREVERLTYMQGLLGKNAAVKKTRLEEEEAIKSASRPDSEPTTERRARLKQEYKEYLAFEHKLLVQLGVVQEAKTDD